MPTITELVQVKIWEAFSYVSPDNQTEWIEIIRTWDSPTIEKIKIDIESIMGGRYFLGVDSSGIENNIIWVKSAPRKIGEPDRLIESIREKYLAGMEINDPYWAYEDSVVLQAKILDFSPRACKVTIRQRIVTEFKIWDEVEESYEYTSSTYAEYSDVGSWAEHYNMYD